MNMVCGCSIWLPRVVAFTMAILWYFGLRTRDAVLKAQLNGFFGGIFSA